MTTPAPDGRAVRAPLAVAGLLTAWFAAMLLKRGEDGFGDSADWLVVAGWAALVLLVLAASWVVPGWRRWRLDWSAELLALREHQDPGPGLREKTDALARQYGGMRWMVWLWPFLALTQVASADWHRPLRATAATALFVGVAVVGAMYYRRLTSAAQRWLADPPGPARDPAGPAVAPEVWRAGDRMALIVLCTLVVALGAGLVVVLVR